MFKYKIFCAQQYFSTPEHRPQVVPALLLHVVADVVHVDLGVQQGGEMGGAQLCSSSHFQVV